MLELGELFLQLDMDVKCSVKETATGTSCSVFVECLVRSLYDARVIGQASVGIGAEHQYLMSIDISDLSALLTCNLTEIRIYSFFHELLRLTVILIPFL